MSVAARVLGFSRQAFYKWLAQPLSRREREEAEMLELIRLIHDDDPEFGYRFISDELHAQGVDVSEKRVWRICNKYGVFSATCKKKGGKKKGKPGPAVADDLIQRHFHAQAINKVWLVDITEHPTGEGKLYLCAFKDVCSRKIVGWAVGARMDSFLALRALHDAMRRRGRPKGVIIHSDRGSQFRSRSFQRALKSYGAKQSMGRVASAGDNAAMESFFSLLQKNVLNRRKWETRAELSTAITYWIERTYHRKRRQRALGKLTPSQFEAIHTTPAALKAA